jgi:hypothetical protein
MIRDVSICSCTPLYIMADGIHYECERCGRRYIVQEVAG